MSSVKCALFCKVAGLHQEDHVCFLKELIYMDLHETFEVVIEKYPTEVIYLCGGGKAHYKVNTYTHNDKIKVHYA